MTSREPLPIRSGLRLSALRQRYGPAAAFFSLLWCAATGAGGSVILALGAALAAGGAFHRRAADPDAVGPLRLLVAALLAFAAAALGLVTGAWSFALLAGLAGALVAWEATTSSLRHQSDEDSRPAVRGLSQLRMHGAAALDELGAEVLRLRSRPGRGAGELAAGLRALDAACAEASWIADPRSVHPIPPPLEKPEILEREDGVRIRYGSEWEASHRALLDPGIAVDRHVDVSLTGSGTEPAILLVPPASPTPLATREMDAAVARWRGHGYAVARYTPPGSRGRNAGVAPPRTCDPLSVAAWIEQCVFELRRLCGWLKSRGAASLGVVGVSWGGSVAAVLASIERDLSAAALVAPVPNPVGWAWRALPAATVGELEHTGFGEERASELLSPWSPLGPAPRLPLEARRIVAPSFDRLASTAEWEALRSRWEEPPWTELPGGRTLGHALSRSAAAVDAHLRRSLQPGAPEARRLSRFR